MSALKDMKYIFTLPEADKLEEDFIVSVGYNAAADKKSWQEMRAFLKEIFEE